jgi:hypothetical protein
MLYMIEQLPTPPNTVELGPGFLPKLVIYVIIFFNAIQTLINIVTKSKNQVEDSGFSARNLVLLLLIMVIYVFSLSWIDYKIGTFLLILSIMFLLGVKRYKLLLMVPAISTLSIFLLFELILNVPLP